MFEYRAANTYLWLEETTTLRMDTENYKDILGRIRALVFDVDGVMTDGTVTVFPSGEFVRRMNVKDGYALQLAVRRGYRVIIITGGRDDSILTRFNRLGITDIVLNATSKLEKLLEYCDGYGIAPTEMLYMGDDVPDIAPMKAVALPCCPNDACTDVLAVAKYVSPLVGGAGCVRDVVEQVLKAQGKWHQEDFDGFNA